MKPRHMTLGLEVTGFIPRTGSDKRPPSSNDHKDLARLSSALTLVGMMMDCATRADHELKEAWGGLFLEENGGASVC